MAAGEPQHWTLRFVDPARERAFMHRYGREVRVFYRVAMLAIVALWTASIGLDLAARPDQRPPMYVIRFGVVMPVILAGVVTGFAPLHVYDRWWHRVAVAVYVTVLAGTVALVVAAPGNVVAYAVGGFLLTILTGAGLDLARAVYITFVGAVLAIAMVAALVASPHTTTRAVMVDSLWVGVALCGAIIISGRAEIARRLRFVQGGLLVREKARTETLLQNMLPASIAARLKDGPVVIADAAPEVTVLFADLKGFTGLAAGITPEQLIARLDRVFSAFDELAQAHGLEKIKTMGDAYMAVAGVPAARADHAITAARMALAMIAKLRELEPTLALRVGLASGPVVAGVIGRTKHSYDLWGATVNLASRMESHGVPGRVQIAERTRDLIGDALPVDAGHDVDLKGIGPTRAFLLASP